MAEACAWPVTYDGCGGVCAPLDTMTPEERAAFEQMAADLLWNWTGRVFGLCDVSVRPCRLDCTGIGRPSTFWGRGPYPWMGQGVGGQWVPVLIAGQWYNLSCGCVSRCNCLITGANVLALPGPVVAVTEVTIDGTVVPATAYHVAYSRYLIRDDGGTWPACQNLLAEAGEPDTFEVTYTRGVSVPAAGATAAGVLACELAKAACNDPTCGLPQRIQTVTRQGLTVAVVDSFEDVTQGRTGIWIVDAWVASINAPRAVAPTVRSVDVPVASPGVGQPWPTT